MRQAARLRFLSALIAAISFSTVSVQSATLDWDITPGTVGAGDSAITGGTGTWNTTLGNFTSDGGANNAAWSNAGLDTARFGGTAGTVTIGTPITVGGLDFDTTGYIINSTLATDTLTLGTTPITIDVASGTTTIINSIIAGGVAGNTLNIVGGGQLTLGNTANTFAHNIVVDGTVAGTTLAGVGQGNNASNRFGATAKSITLTNGGIFRALTGSDMDFSAGSKSIVIGAGGGTIQVDGTQIMDLNDGGQFSNTATTAILTKTGTGTLRIENQGFTYTGTDINVSGGQLHVNNAGNLGTGTTTINLAAGTTFDIKGVTLSGTKAVTINGAGANFIASTGTSAISGVLTLNANANLGGAGNLIVGSTNGGGGTRIITKTGTGAINLGTLSNFTGTTTITGTGGVILNNVNALPLNVTTTSALGEITQTGAAVAGSSYTLPSTAVLGGDTAFFQSLTTGAGGNLSVVPKTIAQTTNSANAAAVTQFSLANDASKYFGIAGNSTDSVTIGTGTPWGGISNDLLPRSWQTGTITANSDFDIQTLSSNLTLGNTATAGQLTITAASPVNANVIGGNLKLDDTTPGFNSNLTFVVTNGAALQTVQSNSLGANATPANNAKVNVLSGGTLNPNAGSTLSGNVTIQPGGILNLDDATNISGTGTITQFAGSITRITNNNALAGTQQTGAVAGTIVRMETSNIAQLTAKTNQAAIFQIFGADRTIGSNTFNGAVITNDGSSRSTQTTTTTAIDTWTIGANGLILAATTGTDLNLNLAGSSTTSGRVIAGTGSTLTIGSNSSIAGNAKAGTVDMSGTNASSTTFDAVNIVAGTLRNLSGGITFNVGTGGTGLITISSGATLDTRTGTTTNGTVNVLAGGTARTRSGNGTDNTIGFAAIAGLEGAGSLRVGKDDTGANRDVNLSIGANNASTLFSGVISDADGTRNGRITKVGTGTLTLSGVNTYTLGTVIDAGTLAVMNISGSGTGAGAVTVNANGTLGGTGIITGAVSFVGGGDLAPGTSPGTLTTGALSLDALTELKYELDTPNVVGSNINDLTIVTGALVLNGELDIIAGGGFGIGSYRLFNYTGALTDNGLTLGDSPSGFSYAFDTATTGQVNLVVAAIPEPSTLVLGGLALLGMTGLRLRRRRRA